ncbi:TPA: hypothetical protein ACH3X1_008141 [Trebouxia sp. C0004]
MAAESRVHIDKLDNQNWGIWRRKLKALFLSKRLAGVIDGTDEDKDSSSQVLGLIQLHLSDAYLSMADDVATGKPLWDKLEAVMSSYVMEVDTTGASCPVLPRTLTKKSHSFLCLLRAAQLPSWGSIFGLLALQQYWCLHRHVTRATVGFDGGEPEQGKV